MTSDDEKQVGSAPGDLTTSNIQALSLSNDTIEGKDENKSENKDATINTKSRKYEDPKLEVPAQQQWNHPRIHIWRVLAACYGLLMMGMNDAAYGVCKIWLFHV